MKKLRATTLLILLCVLAYFGNAQIISTIAGNGIVGFSGDNGQAIAAEFNDPQDVALDDSGNIYIGDVWNYRIRRVSALTGIITTIAGTVAGYSGDGGEATNAELDYTNAIAFDTFGNIYIADGNIYVREIIKSTGIINTIAGITYYRGSGYSGDGGQATLAEFSGIEDIALDDSNNIFIADAGNNVIRKVSASTGIVNTIVGNGYGGYSGNGGPATNAELDQPDALALDKLDNIYIADSRNNVIREVTASNGIITKIAGIHIMYGGYTGDGGPAIAAEIRNPLGIFLDDSGNIFIGDNGNNAIRKVSEPSGIINTYAGNGTGLGGYYGDGGPATEAEISSPVGVTIDALGNLYIADQSNNVIRKVTPDTNTVTGVNKLRAMSEEVRVLPNPSNGVFNLYMSNIGSKCNIEIYNILGEKVYNPMLNQVQGDNEINLSSQPNGIYLYRVLTQTGNLVGEGKLIIQK